MKSPQDHLTIDLSKIPRSDSSLYTVEKHSPQFVFSPRNQEEVSLILKEATRQGWRVLPWGGGTWITFGAPLHGLDAVILLKNLNKIIELDDENLTVTVEAGICWADLQKALANCGRGFEVPLDPPLPDQATVGGVLASGSSGPRRNLYGSVRNIVLGATVLTARGERVRFGGKTVKNVSGLDMTKAFLGSLGTLGIVVEATLRFLPFPLVQTTALLNGEPTALWELAEAVLASSLYPAALSWLPPESFKEIDNEPTVDGVTMAVALEGTHEGVKERWEHLVSLCHGVSIKRVEEEEGKGLWAQIQNFAIPPSRFKMPLTLKVTLPPARSHDLATCLEESSVPFYLIHLGTGEAWAHWDLEDSESDLLSLVQRLRKTVQDWEGHLIVVQAPLNFKDRIDIWGLNPVQRSLIWALKARLDPQKILAPGRWGDPL